MIKSLTGLGLVLAAVGGGYWLGQREGPTGEPPDGTGLPEVVWDGTLDAPALFDASKIVEDEASQGRIVRGQILVAFREPLSNARIRSTLVAAGIHGRVVGAIPAARTIQLEFDGDDLHAAAAKLAANEQVRTASVNHIWTTARVLDDPALTNADVWDDWGIQRIHAPAAWDITTGNGVVAIVDSGLLLDHEEVDGRTVAPYSYATVADRPAAVNLSLGYNFPKPLIPRFHG